MRCGAVGFAIGIELLLLVLAVLGAVAAWPERKDR